MQADKRNKMIGNGWTDGQIDEVAGRDFKRSGRLAMDLVMMGMAVVALTAVGSSGIVFASRQRREGK